MHHSSIQFFKVSSILGITAFYHYSAAALLKDGKIIFLSELSNDKERDNMFLIKSNSELVSIANLKKGYIIPRRNFNN